MTAECECGQSISWHRSESDWKNGEPIKRTWFFKCSCDKKFSVVEDL